MKTKNFFSNLLVGACAFAALMALGSATCLAAPVTAGVPFTTANITDLAGNVTITPAANPTVTITPKL